MIYELSDKWFSGWLFFSILFYSESIATMGLFDVLAGMLKLRKEQINILVVGLNNSGKSTIVNHFKNPEERPSITVPTVGFSVEKFQSELLFSFFLFCSG